MINFHFPPIAAKAAVNGHPPTGLGSRSRAGLPKGAFLKEFTGQSIFLPENVYGSVLHNGIAKEGYKDEVIQTFANLLPVVHPGRCLECPSGIRTGEFRHIENKPSKGTGWATRF